MFRRLFFFDADSGAGGGGGENPKQDEGSGGEDEWKDFNPEWAKATIIAQRESEKKARAELKAAQERLTAIDEAERKRKEAELSEAEKAKLEVERLRAEAEAAKAAQQAATQKAQEALMRSAVLLAAASFQDPEDAWKFLDRSKVTVGEDGSVSGADKAVETLAKAKPYLLKQAGQPRIGTPGGRKPDDKQQPEKPAGEKPPLVRL